MISPRTVAPVAALGALLLGSGAFAEIVHVPTEQPTIQAAIDASANGDEIVLADGTYTGVGNKDLTPGGRAITIRSENGPDGCIIDLQGSGVGFDLTAADGDGLQVEGLTLTDSGFGGLGLRCNGASPTITNCVFDGFYFGALGGGAVDVAGGAPVFRHCTFRDNLREGECGAAGGAIFASGGALRIEDCHFEANEAGGGPCAGLGFGYGGAISLGSGATLDAVRTTFVANRADSIGAALGGAVFVEGNARFANCVFRENVAISFSDFTNHGAGGAVYVDGFQGSGGVATFVNCLMTGNESFGTGGAVENRGTCELYDCTIADNVAWDGNCGFDGCGEPGNGEIQTGANTTTTVRNSIIRSMQPDAIVGPGVVDVAYSNVTTSGGAIGTGNIDLDPLFVSAVNDDYRLADGSPSIDTGSNAALPADELDLDDDGDVKEPLPVDLDDAPRVVGPAVDMGAYETGDTCAADLDGSGDVGFTDLTMLLGSWGDCLACPEDLDGDGLVGFTDLTALIAAWGPCA
jgi:hypothetical protein